MLLVQVQQSTYLIIGNHVLLLVSRQVEKRLEKPLPFRELTSMIVPSQ